MIADKSEHAMVRHEAAEALGAIAGDSCHPEEPEIQSVLAVLKEFQADDDRIVAESCDVALDIHDYWQNDEEVDTNLDA